MQATSDSIGDDFCMPVNFSNCGSSNSERDGDVAIMPANVTSSVETSDPYSYLNRGDYTSEAYKLELMNLPKRFGIAVSFP